MSLIIEALLLAKKIESMDLERLFLVRESTDNPKFHEIIDKAIEMKLPKNTK